MTPTTHTPTKTAATMEPAPEEACRGYGYPTRPTVRVASDKRSPHPSRDRRVTGYGGLAATDPVRSDDRGRCVIQSSPGTRPASSRRPAARRTCAAARRAVRRPGHRRRGDRRRCGRWTPRPAGCRWPWSRPATWPPGTSSRSSKLIHGGLRYLEQLEFGLVHEALRERGLLATRLAPHLVRPVPFLVPLPQRGRRPAGAGPGSGPTTAPAWPLYDAFAGLSSARRPRACRCTGT